MSRIINDVEVLGKLISSDLKDAIIDFFYIVTHLFLLMYLSWKMFLAVFIVVPIVMGPVSAFADKIRKATRNQQERLSSLNGHLQEVISGIRVIRAFSMEKVEAKRFWEFNQDLSDKTFKGHFYHQVGPSLTELFSSIIAVIFLSFGAYLMEDGTFSRGMFMAFFLTLIFLMRPFKQMSMLSNSIQSAISAGSRVFELLDQETDIQNPASPRFLKKMEKGLSFNNVTFTYPGAKTPAVQEINLEIPKGETVALVGASGAGKSTLVDLVPRLIDPQEGQIFIDGIDIRELDLSNLRKRIGIVAQQVFLFNGTIRENICYGNQSVTEEQLHSACEQAFAMEFILSFEEGFDTVVGERGVMLSGGQRQRIAIARALLLNPEILILDEATSALDTESERLVQQALESLYKNRTVIIIAHRLSTVQIANTIFAMEDGRIVESGTHAELIQLDGKYKKLYDIQFVESSESV